nr:glycine-rich RNA-binding protein 4, mitochondrial [Tanacetum cinerariifolium]
MNKALALIAKAFKCNTIPTNNNQRSSLIPCNSQIAQPDMNTSQDIKMKMVDDNVENQGLSVVSKIANQYGNGNVETAPAEGNVKPRKRDAAYLQQHLQIALEEEAWIQSTQEEFEFMTAADAYEETKRVKVNCTSENTLHQASTSGTQSHNAPVYDSDGSTEIERLQAQLGDLKGKSSDTQCASNTLDYVSQKPEDENMSLESQVSEQKGISKGTRTNTKCTKQSILGKPPSSSFKPKLYSVTPFPKSSVLPKVDKMNALSKPVTSNSAPSTRELKVMQTVNVIARIFRTNPSKTSRLCLVTTNHDVCVLNYVNDMNSLADNQSANVSIRENQKKHKANAKKSKKLGSIGSLASSRLSEPRTYLRWIPTRRIFSMCGKLTASSNTENKSKKSVCDNASTSNPSKLSSKGFLNSASLLGSVITEREPERSMGFGFMDYDTDESANEAMKAMDGQVINN